MSDSPDPPVETRVPAPERSGSAERRVRLTLLALGGLYLLSLWVLLAIDQFGVVWKSLVIPLVALAAASLGRLKQFVRDWAVFLGAVVLFDAGRGLIYRLVMHFQLPVYMGYAIRAEKAVFGEPLLMVRVQALLTPSGQVGAIDKLLAGVYGSHFVCFLFFGLALWLLREREFRRWQLTLLCTMYAGLVCYLVVPTVPPWMAAHQYFVLPDIHEFGAELFRANLPSLTATFDINTIAAMPSLHCAFPTLLTLFALRLFGRFGWVMLAYTLLVYVSTVHLGHHYGVDVLGGIALALAIYALCMSSSVTKLLARREQRAANQGLRAPLLATGAILLLAHASSLLDAVLAIDENPLPTLGFVARELDGKSPMAAYYRGRYAHAQGRYARASQLFAEAAHELHDDKAKQAALQALLVSAAASHDYPRVVTTASALHALPPNEALFVAEALIKTGKRTAGFRLLDSVSHDYRGNAQVAQLKAELEPYRR